MEFWNFTKKIKETAKARLNDRLDHKTGKQPETKESATIFHLISNTITLPSLLMVTTFFCLRIGYWHKIKNGETVLRVLLY